MPSKAGSRKARRTRVRGKLSPAVPKATNSDAALTTYYGRARDHRVLVIVSRGNDIESGPLPIVRPSDFWAWGKSEPGATLLARALLLHCTGSDAEATKFYQRFKHRVVREWDDAADFTITAPEIRAVVAEIQAVEKETAPQRRAAAAAQSGPVVSEGGQGVEWQED